MAREVHVIVRLGGKAVYDFSSSARANDAASSTEADLAREHLLKSVQLMGG